MAAPTDRDERSEHDPGDQDHGSRGEAVRPSSAAEPARVCDEKRGQEGRGDDRQYHDQQLADHEPGEGDGTGDEKDLGA